jgi:hypothetical protein
MTFTVDIKSHSYHWEILINVQLSLVDCSWVLGEMDFSYMHLQAYLIASICRKAALHVLFLQWQKNTLNIYK